MASYTVAHPGTPALGWMHSRRRWGPYLALALSFLLHTLAFVLAPHAFSSFSRPEPAPLDVVLIPLSPSLPPPLASSRAATAPSPRKARPASADRVLSPAEIASAPVAATSLPPAPAPLEPLAPAPAPVMALAELKPLPPPRPLQSFPPRIGISYKLTSSVVDGVATFAWKRDGNRYEISSALRADGFFADLLVGTLRQTSRGEVTADGLKPSYFSLQRGDGAPETAEFLRDDNQLRMTSRGDIRTQNLPDRMQDMQSFLFQMAAEAPRLRTSGDAIDVQVTNARKVYQHRFRLVGEESVTTRLGSITALHLKSDATDPEDVYEAWLAPQYLYLPVKLRFFMGRYPVEQTATTLGVSPE